MPVKLYAKFFHKTVDQNSWCPFWEWRAQYSCRYRRNKGDAADGSFQGLAPPKKWSYFKLIIRFAILSFVALVVYIRSVMGSASTPSSPPVKLYGLVAPCFFVVLASRHNHRTFPREYAESDRSFMCCRCGAVFAELA